MNGVRRAGGHVVDGLDRRLARRRVRRHEECATGAGEAKAAFAAEKKFPFGNLKGRAPTALQLLLFEEMVPEVGVEPTRF